MKNILTYHLSFKKYHVDLDLFKLDSKLKNNIFQSYKNEDKKYTKNFSETNFKLFKIYIKKI